MTEVKCKVKSCHYWGNGDVCEAETIVVDNNHTNSTASRIEAGEEGAISSRFGAFEISNLDAQVAEPKNASTSEETLCRTFRPKGNTSRG